LTAEVRASRDGERPGILAIIPHYGRPEMTLAAAKSLEMIGYPRLRVVVVDNGHNLDADRLPEGIDLIVPPSNIGYCAAVNIGLAQAIEHGYELLLLINNDTEIASGVIEGMVDVLGADDSVAGVGPLLTTDGGDRIWSAGAFLRFGPNQVKQRGLGRRIEEAPRFPAEVDFIPGALALYRTADLKAIGGIDDDYFMYLEDVDLGLRLRQAGRRLLYVPWLRAYHGGSVSSGGGVTPLRKFLNGVNTPRVLRRARSVRLWLSFVLFDVIGLLPSMLPHLLDPGRLAAQLAKARGIVLGLSGYRPGLRDVERYVARDRAR
jgi:GT2 family glycosyltransferase